MSTLKMYFIFHNYALFLEGGMSFFKKKKLAIFFSSFQGKFLFYVEFFLQ